METHTAEDIYSEIVKNNVRREHRSFFPGACYSGSALRRKDSDEPERGNVRPAFARDADRIIHSRAYARYIDKTQVFSLFENDHITHRVPHVQLVSKIGRVIGRCLRLNEDLIEAIALGHDLGHVPYGHDGERELERICVRNGAGYFCHNAQSVKFLTEIENKGEGLNLSLQVLDGILAHNGELLSQEYAPQKSKTWETHQYEYERCFLEEDFSKRIFPMTLEGCVVRISDVIAYVGRDFDDAITVNLIQRKDIPRSVANVLGNDNRTIINTLVMDLVKNSYGKEYLLFTKEIHDGLKELRTFNASRIYHNPRIKTESGKVRQMFHYLFRKYLHDLRRKDTGSPLWSQFLKDLPVSYRQDTPEARIVVDFISGMTDDFFNNQFKDCVVPKKFGYELPQVGARAAGKKPAQWT